MKLHSVEKKMPLNSDVLSGKSHLQTIRRELIFLICCVSAHSQSAYVTGTEHIIDGGWRLWDNNSELLTTVCCFSLQKQKSTRFPLIIIRFSIYHSVKMMPDIVINYVHNVWKRPHFEIFSKAINQLLWRWSIEKKPQKPKQTSFLTCLCNPSYSFKQALMHTLAWPSL